MKRERALTMAAVLLAGLISNAVRADDEVSFDGPTEGASEKFFNAEPRRYAESPREIIQRNAAAKSAARRQRIESQNWYGYSQSRPVISGNPWTGSYGTTGLAWYRYHWWNGRPW